MESCHKLTLEDSRDRVPLPRFGGDDREQPADDAAAEAFDSLKGALHAPRRWGLSSEAIGTLGFQEQSPDFLRLAEYHSKCSRH